MRTMWISVDSVDSERRLVALNSLGNVLTFASYSWEKKRKNENFAFIAGLIRWPVAHCCSDNSLTLGLIAGHLKAIPATHTLLSNVSYGGAPSPSRLWLVSAPPASTAFASSAVQILTPPKSSSRPLPLFSSSHIPRFEQSLCAVSPSKAFLGTISCFLLHLTFRLPFRFTFFVKKPKT